MTFAFETQLHDDDIEPKYRRCVELSDATDVVQSVRKLQSRLEVSVQTGIFCLHPEPLSMFVYVSRRDQHGSTGKLPDVNRGLARRLFIRGSEPYGYG